MGNRNTTMHPIPGNFRGNNTAEGFTKREQAAIQLMGTGFKYSSSEIVRKVDELFDILDATKDGGIK